GPRDPSLRDARPIVLRVPIDHDPDVATRGGREAIGRKSERRSAALPLEDRRKRRAIGRKLDDEVVLAEVAAVPSNRDAADLSDRAQIELDPGADAEGGPARR